MQLTKEQETKLKALLSINLKELNDLLMQNKGVSKEQLIIALCDYEIITDANNKLNEPFIEQVGNLVNDACMNLKTFRNILSRIKYQKDKGNINNLKGYTLNSLAKETRQAVYKR